MITRRRTRIRHKILISTFVVVLTAMTITSFVIYKYETNIQKNQSIAVSIIKLEQVTSQLTSIGTRGNTIIQNIITDEVIMETLVDYNSLTDEEQFYRRYDITENLEKYVALNEPICNIILKGQNTLFGSSSGYEKYYGEILQEEWYQEFKNKKINQGYTQPHYIYFSSINKKEPVISYVMEFTNVFSENKEKEIIILDIKYEAIKKIFDEATANFERIFLIDNEGEVLYASQSEVNTIDNQVLDYVKDMNEGFKEVGDNIIIVNTSFDTNLKQVAIISKSKLFKTTNAMFIFILVTIVGSVLFIVLAMTPIILNITNPISRLIKVMEHVAKGDLDQNINIKTGDELELLGIGFNKMISDLKTYIRNSVDNEKKKRKMQMTLLMAQINPHFLYNTLNNINYLIVANRNQDATNMTECLIDLLNDTVQIDCEYATVTDELVIIEKYIQIQHYRYRDKFSYHHEVEEGTERAKIPRTIIQPIVENALFHGISPLDHTGEIKILISAQEDKLQILITDTGVGMSKEIRNQLFDNHKTKEWSNQTRSIGLNNIDERLAYIYGERYEIKVASEIDFGTTVEIKIPLNFI